ncbi:heterokaryon incompatibility protein-domain-containing protein [Rhexocercosporidium sp. MPI-PUGE-AT-0058]|nr:heterokaryon incompatibility protein-domain-containing protein [Rhexocercosporidium sp. MPI-PUGE-AT-0058]
MPCDVCFSLDRFSDEHDRWRIDIKADLMAEYSLTFTFSKLGASAESGCETCSVVLSGLKLISRNLSLFDVARDYSGRFILQSDHSLEVEIFDKEEQIPVASPCARIQFYTLPGSFRGDKGPFSTASDVPFELSVETCSSTVFDWIKDCRLNHEACTAEKPEKKELPHRLLDLKQREAASVFLVETRDNSACRAERYATLSHCWGKAHVIQTIKGNLLLRMQGIDWDSLPKTFQDAVAIVRALSIRFLWIDSLCIVQDDILDWKRESVRMAVIYSNSYINIAATGASDSRGGCLYPRSLKHTIPMCDITSFPIEIQKDPQQPTIFVRPSLERVHQRYSTRSSYEFDLPDSQTVPLLSRAWVFQERHLAPRTLHFHPSEMVMECKSGLRCECSGLDSVPPRGWRGSLHLTSSERGEIFKSWLDVVEEYSKLCLSRESDRLPALTGVATVFQRRLGCAYLAGIWQDDIARGILWAVTRHQRVWSLRSVHRHNFAPTWSWASLTMDAAGSRIMFPAGHDDTFKADYRFSFLSTDIPFAATDYNLTTPAAHHSISLRGVSRAATAHPKILEAASWKDSTLVFEQEVEDLVLISVAQMNLDCTWKSPDTCPLEAGTELHCLMVGNKVNKDRESGRETQYQCSLVLKASSLNLQLFERVGVLSATEDLGLFHLASESLFEVI